MKLNAKAYELEGFERIQSRVAWIDGGTPLCFLLKIENDTR